MENGTFLHCDSLEYRNTSGAEYLAILNSHGDQVFSRRDGQVNDNLDTASLLCCELCVTTD